MGEEKVSEGTIFYSLGEEEVYEGSRFYSLGGKEVVEGSRYFPLGEEKVPEVFILCFGMRNPKAQDFILWVGKGTRTLNMLFFSCA